MAIDISKLAEDMLNAAKGPLTKQWPEIKDYAEMEMKKIAESIAAIEKMKLAGKITEEKASLQIDIQKNATRTVLLAVEGIGLVSAEQAINAALNVVRDTVNKAIGWALL
jgi:soluble cytochrome b562